MSTLTFLSENLDHGNVCPACPKVGIMYVYTYSHKHTILTCFQPLLIQDSSGPAIVSMDALFGLPRKKSAGTSVRSPLFGHTMFMDQNTVDEYVAAESIKKLRVPKVR